MTSLTVSCSLFCHTFDDLCGGLILLLAIHTLFCKEQVLTTRNHHLQQVCQLMWCRNLEAERHISTPHEQHLFRWQKGFQQRASQVHELKAQMRGNMKTANMLLRLRSITRVFEHAATQECQWIAGKDIATDAPRGHKDRSVQCIRPHNSSPHVPRRWRRPLVQNFTNSLSRRSSQQQAKGQLQ